MMMIKMLAKTITSIPMIWVKYHFAKYENIRSHFNFAIPCWWLNFQIVQESFQILYVFKNFCKKLSESITGGCNMEWLLESATLFSHFISKANPKWIYKAWKFNKIMQTDSQMCKWFNHWIVSFKALKRLCKLRYICFLIAFALQILCLNVIIGIKWYMRNHCVSM